MKCTLTRNREVKLSMLEVYFKDSLHNLENIVDAMIPLLLPADVLCHCFVLLLPGGPPVVDPRVGSVPVLELGDVGYPPTGHLQSRVVDGIIVEGPVEFALVVLEGLYPLEHEQIGHHGPEVAVRVGVSSVGDRLNDVKRVLFRYADTERGIGVVAIVADEIRIKNVKLIFLVEGVVKFENLSADEFVIPINDKSHLVEIAVFVSGIVNVFQSSSAHLVSQQDKLVLGNLSPVQVLGYLVARAVGGGVVDDDHPVVRVLLLEEGLDVPGVSVVLVIVVGGSHHAGMQLILIITSIELLLVVLLLPLINLPEIFFALEVVAC